MTEDIPVAPVRTPPGVEGSEPPGEDLHRIFVHSLAWTAGVRWFNQILTWISTLIVARILSPEDFGLISMASVYLGVITLVSEFGLGSAIVTLRDMTPAQVAQLNLAAVLVGIISFGVSCLAAAPLGTFFHAPQLPVVVIVMSLGFVVGSFRSVPYALMQRSMSFKRLAIIDGLQSLLLSAAMVVLAVLGFGYWTLAIGHLLAAVLSTLLTLTQCRSTFSWPRWSAIKQAIRFSQRMIVARLAWYVYSNADFFIAGRRLGKEPLGAYTLAWTLGSLPVEKISALIFSVTPAYFSAIQRDFAALRRNLLNLTEAISMMTVPLTIGLALVAGEFVPLALGPQWAPMIAPLRLLAAYAAVRSITPLLPQVLAVIGELPFSMWNSVAAAVLLPIAFYVGCNWGIVGLAAAWIVVHPLILIPLYVRTFQRIGLSPLSYLRALLPAAHAALYMVVIVVAARSVVPISLPIAYRLALLVLSGAIAYIGGLMLHHRERVTAIVRTLREIRSGTS